MMEDWEQKAIDAHMKERVLADQYVFELANQLGVDVGPSVHAPRVEISLATMLVLMLKAHRCDMTDELTEWLRERYQINVLALEKP